MPNGPVIMQKPVKWRASSVRQVEAEFGHHDGALAEVAHFDARYGWSETCAAPCVHRGPRDSHTTTPILPPANNRVEGRECSAPKRRDGRQLLEPLHRAAIQIGDG